MKQPPMKKINVLPGRYCHGICLEGCPKDIKTYMRVVCRKHERWETAYSGLDCNFALHFNAYHTKSLWYHKMHIHNKFTGKYVEVHNWMLKLHATFHSACVWLKCQEMLLPHTQRGRDLNYPALHGALLSLSFCSFVCKIIMCNI
jgi:hypothetical protein